jgi:hypothetical protein
MTSRERRVGRFGGRLAGVAAIAGIAILVAIGIGLYFGFRTTHRAAPPQPVATSPSNVSSRSHASSPATVAAATRQHTFMPPECKPMQGPRWVYPGPTHISSTTYETYAIGYSCAQAAMWTKRMIQDFVPPSQTGALVPVHNGPPGYFCGAWADAAGRAYAGGCNHLTTNSDNTSSFGWNWNVGDPRVVFTPGANGKLQKLKVAGADSLTTVRPLSPGHYELLIHNTSGIGFINGIVWQPPAGWTIKSISNVSGARCSLTSGSVSCHGVIDPPSCLCRGDGGEVTVDMAVTAVTHAIVDGHPVYYGSVGAITDLTAMTPVPFLIPGTPAEAARQYGR